jgi:pimeloyl-ACP methyl ester carboxylesterase
MAPLGLHDTRAPIPHIWARRAVDLPGYLCVDTDALAALQSVPEGENPVEWNIAMARASAAAGRLLWPMCDLGLEKRLHRVKQPVLLIWGGQDRILGQLYSTLFQEKLAGPVTTANIAKAGHLIDIDAPGEAAGLIADFLMPAETESGGVTAQAR